MYIRTMEELKNDDREKLVIDVRDKEEFEKETYPDAIHIYWEDLRKDIDEETDIFLSQIPKDKPVYLLCYTGPRSEEIAADLSDRGYEIYSIDGGYHAYLRDKLANLLGDEEKTDDKAKDVERSIVKKFRKPIWRKFTKAINEYEMIQDGDKIAVCISGGKDSMLMAKLFQELYRHGKKNFEVVFLVMNPGYNDINYETIKNNAKLLNVPITVFKSEIFDIVAGEGNSPCYLCARMRRGHLYSKAKELGCNKIALGHHFSDVIETTLIGMFYGSQLQAMLPKLHSDHFEGMTLIRPMYCIHEEDILAWKRYNDLEFIQCACRFTENCTMCDNGGGGSKRQEVKLMLRQLKRKNPLIEKSIFNSIHSVCLDTMVGYKSEGVEHSFLERFDATEDSLLGN